MKKIIILITSILILSFSTQKEYKIKDKTVAKIRNCLVTVYEYLDKSNLPHQDVIKIQQMIVDADTFLRNDIDSTIKK